MFALAPWGSMPSQQPPFEIIGNCQFGGIAAAEDGRAPSQFENLPYRHPGA